MRESRKLGKQKASGTASRYYCRANKQFGEPFCGGGGTQKGHESEGERSERETSRRRRRNSILRGKGKLKGGTYSRGGAAEGRRVMSAASPGFKFRRDWNEKIAKPSVSNQECLPGSVGADFGVAGIQCFTTQLVNVSTL